MNRTLAWIVSAALVAGCAYGLAIAAPPAAAPAKPAVTRPGLIVDLDADKGVETQDGKVTNWRNQVDWKAKDFKATRPDGRPSLRKSVQALRGRAALDFEQQELVNDDEDAFDPLVTGAGYTWLAVLAAHKQVGAEPNVNCFFGNLKNGGFFEGFWGGLDDDNTVWIGSRNSNSFGRYNDDNPKVSGPKLEENKFYVVAGRMGAGAGKVTIDLYVNNAKPAASKPFPVNPRANSSKMAIGQERDATNHPGRESFKGEIARMLFWERPLTDAELAATMEAVRKEYGL